MRKISTLVIMGDFAPIKATHRNALISRKSKSGGCLAEIISTMFHTMGKEVQQEMTGRCLVEA